MRKLSCLFLSLVGACSSESPAPPADVQKHLTDDLAHVLHEAQSASDGSTANAPDATVSLLGKALGLDTTVSASAPALRRFAPMVARFGARVRVAPADPTTDDATDQLIDELNTKLFIDANYVGDGVYTVPASLVCAVDDTTGAIDATCAQQVADAQLRVRVTEDDDKLDFAIQLDANHDEPLSIALRHDSLAVTLSLDDAGRAIAALAPLFGEQAPNANLSGAITGELDILGTAHAKASVTIDRDIAIAVADTGVDLNGPDAVRITSAAAPVFAIEMDGNAPSLSADVALGNTTAHVPYTDTDSSGTETKGTIDLDLGGVTASAKLDSTGLSLSNLGLGDHTTTVKKDGVQAIAIDINPDDGRKFSITATADANGVETVTPTPKLDVRVAVDHAALGDTAPIYDVTQLLVTGSLQGVGDDIKVLSGEFKIATNPASFGIDATAGQCATAVDVVDNTTGDEYTQWSAGACQ